MVLIYPLHLSFELKRQFFSPQYNRNIPPKRACKTLATPGTGSWRDVGIAVALSPLVWGMAGS